MSIATDSRVGPTAALLWGACRLDPAGADIAAAIEAGADLERAAGEALYQRVSGLLVRGLHAADVDTTAPWAGEIVADAMRCRAHADLVLPQLGARALEPLAAAGLEAVVFKGGSLAERYPAPGLRAMDDVDLVLPERFHAKAIDALVGAGWAVARTAGGIYYDAVLVHPRMPGLPLELHRAMSTWQLWANGLSAEELWERRVPQTVFGAPAFGLPPEIEIVALAGHASKPFHLFDRLIWSVDVAVVVDAASRGGAIDWDVVDRTARGVGCRTAVAALLTQARRLGAAVPAALCEPTASGPRRRALAPLFEHEWPIVPNNVYRRRLEFSVVDGWYRRLGMAAAWTMTEGLAKAPGRAFDLGGAAIRRWLQLRTGPRPPR